MRKWLTRRRFAGGAVICLAALGAAAALYGPRLLPTRWVRGLVVALVQESLRTALRQEVRVDLEAAEWRRWNEVRLTNLTVSRPKQSEPFFSMADLRLRVHLWDLLHRKLVVKSLRIKRPRLSVDKETLAHLQVISTGAPREVGEEMAFAVEEVRIQQGALTIADGAKTLFQTSDFTLNAKSGLNEPLYYDASLTVASPLLPARLRSTGEFVAFPNSAPSLIIQEMSFASAPIRARAAGKLLFGAQGPSLDVRVAARGSVRDLQKFAARLTRPLPELGQFSGIVCVDFRVRGPFDDIRVEGTADVPPGQVRIGQCLLPFGTFPHDIRYAISLRERDLILHDLTILSPMGTLAIKGEVTELKSPRPRARLSLSGRDVDVGQIFLRVCDSLKSRPEGWKVAGKVNGDLLFRTEWTRDASPLYHVEGRVDWGPLEVIGFGALTLKPANTPWELRLKTTVEDQTLRIHEGTQFNGDIFQIHASGSVSFDAQEPTLDLTALSDMDLGRALRRWGRAVLELPDGLDVTGRAHTVTRVAGKRSDLALSWTNDASEVAWWLNGKPLKEAGPPAGSYLKARLVGSTLTIQQADFHSQFGKASLSGAISHLEAKPVFALTLSSQISLPAVLAVLSKHGYCLSPEWKAAGTSRLLDVTIQGDVDHLTARGTLDMKDASVMWRGAYLLQPDPEKTCRWAISCERGRIRLDEVQFRSRNGELTLSPSTEGRRGLKGRGVLHVGQFRPLLDAALGYLKSGARGSNLPPAVKTLLDRVDADLHIGGAVEFPVLSVQDWEDGIRFQGAANLKPLTIAYRGLAWKSAADAASADLEVNVKPDGIQLAGATLKSDLGLSRLSGLVDLARQPPRFEAHLQTSADIQKLLALLPAEKVKSDGDLDKALQAVGIIAEELDEKFDLAGLLSTDVKVAGPPGEVTVAFSADLTDMDVTYSAAFKKPTRQFARVAFVGRATSKSFTLTSASLESAHDRVALEGAIVLSPQKIVGRDVRIAFRDKALNTSFALSHVRPGGFWLDEFDVKTDSWFVRLEGPVVCEPTFIQAEAAKLWVNKDVVHARFSATDYLGNAPEIRLWVRGGTLDLRPLIPAEGKPAPAFGELPVAMPPTPSRVAPEQVLTLLNDLADYLRRARIDISLLIGQLAFHLYDAVDRNPGVRVYEARDLSLEAQLNHGVLKLEALAGLNGGMINAVANSNFNRRPVTTRVDFWATSIGAHDNLRPFLNLVFPNLYVDGSFSMTTQLEFQGMTGAELDATAVGVTRMDIVKGHMLGKAAPDFILKVFPNLNLYDYRFDDGKIVTKTKGPVAKTKATFNAPTFSLYMEGQTDNITKNVDYVLGVDMIASMGLESGRSRIPKFWQDSAKVNIARYRGHLHDQHVEWFTPQVDTMRNVLTHLLQIHSIQVLTATDKTGKEKAEYFGKKFAHLLLFPVDTTKRIIGGKKPKKEPWQKPEPPERERDQDFPTGPPSETAPSPKDSSNDR